MIAPRGAAAWTLYLAQICGVVGTFAAVSVALTLGVLAIRRESRQRDVASKAQARLVLARLETTSSTWRVAVLNHTDHAVTSVRCSVALRPGADTSKVPAWRLRGPEQHDFIPAGSAEQFAFVPPDEPQWQQEDRRGTVSLPVVNANDYWPTVTWTDNGGVAWRRTGLDEPAKVVGRKTYVD